MKKTVSKLLGFIISASIVCTAVGCNSETPSSDSSHEHTYATAWSSDDAHHWKAATCEHTDEVAEKTAHSFAAPDYTCVCGTVHTHAYATDWSSDDTHHWKAATCGHTVEGAEKAEHSYDANGSCTCGKVQAHEHTFATDWSSDDTHHWKSATCEHTDEVSEKAAHSYAAPDYTCTCGKAHTHTYATDWSSDGTYHWKAATCEHTDEVSEKAEHDFTQGNCACGKKQPAAENVVYMPTSMDELIIDNVADDESAGQKNWGSAEFDATKAYGNNSGSIKITLNGTSANQITGFAFNTEFGKEHYTALKEKGYTHVYYYIQYELKDNIHLYTTHEDLAKTASGSRVYRNDDLSVGLDTENSVKWALAQNKTPTSIGWAEIRVSLDKWLEYCQDGKDIFAVQYQNGSTAISTIWFGGCELIQA